MDLDALLAQMMQGPTDEQKRAARQQALAAAGFGILGANGGGGWQGAVRAAGRGGLLGMNVYNNEMANQQQAPMQNLDMISRVMAMKGQQQQMEDRDAAKQSNAAFAQQLGGVFAPPQGPQLGNMGAGGPTPENAQRVAPPQASPQDRIAQYRRVADMYTQRGDAENAKKFDDIADRMQEEYSTTPQVVMQGGKPTLMQFGKRGTTRAANGMEPPPDMQILNLGGRQQAVDKRTVAPGATFDVTMDPAQKDASARGWADINDRRAKERAEGAAGGAAAGKPSDQQLSAQSFLDRMQNASKTLTKFESAGYAPGIPAALVEASGNIPIVGGMTKGIATLVGNQAMPQTQLYRQAQEEWVRAKLRKESGAVIGPKEMDDEVRTYFPQAGDSAEMIKQKARARAVAEQSIANQASGVRQSQSSGPVAGGREASGTIGVMRFDSQGNPI